MSDILETFEMSEADIRRQFIDPVIEAKWNPKKITRETSTKLNFFTDGKVNIQGNVAKREKPEFCDYILWLNPQTPLAIVEAKNMNKSALCGMQQAINYGTKLRVPFVYTSNGKSFFEHDFITGNERELEMNEFPTEEELLARWKNVDVENIVVVKDKTQNDIDNPGIDNAYDVPLYFDEKLMEIPFYTGEKTFPPRYYQRNAVNEVLRAVSNDKKRILLAMATGTGKTYTAFQIVWRLLKANKVSKVLYLADRNNLVDQSIQQDFSPLEKVIKKIEFKNSDKSKLSAYQVYFALYQQLDSKKTDDQVETDEEIQDEISKYKEFFEPNFFDLIIVDECHRGSAKSDSRWRKILDYFSSAIHLGMTATPKETKYVSNINYFGEPVYQYSLKQGIQDGFLAPFKVITPITNIDESWQPTAQMLEKHPDLEDREYGLADYDKNIILDERTELVANEITKFLKQTDRFSKTIVFCPTEAAAERMRMHLNNLNTDMIKRDAQGNVQEQYVVRITGGDKYGKEKLDYFISKNEKYPVIATTSDLLSTGTDCKMVKLIVIDKIINTMTEFKQILGRGTRLLFDEGKTHFTLMDFRRVSRHFADPDWDGEIEQEQNFEENGDNTNGSGCAEPKPPKKYPYIKDGLNVEILQRLESVYDTDGKLLRQEKIEDYTKNVVLNNYQNLDIFMQSWKAQEKKEAIKKMLLSRGIDLQKVKEDQNMSDVDDYDFICHIAFNQKPLTKSERAKKAKQNDIFAKYSDEAKQIINALIDKYAEFDVYQIESADILKQSPFINFGSPARIAKVFGGREKYWSAIKEIESALYA